MRTFFNRLWKGPAQKSQETFAYSPTNVACDFPLWRFEIMAGGEIFHCCPTWLPHPVSNITKTSILEAYHSELSSDIRREVLEGSFKYCKANLCPYLSRYVNLGEIHAPIHPREKAAEILETRGADRAKRLLIMLNYDASCNLRCPSCRNETILFNEETAPPLLRQIHFAVLRNIEELRAAGFELTLNVTGSGDAFASPLYASLLQNLAYDSRLHLELQTNGVLMEEARFTEAMFKMLKFLAVSVDAASPAVYEKVRRGGSFSRLLKNLDWIDLSIRNKRFANDVYYKINFIVQQDNFREIVPFAEWMLSYSSVSEIWFNLIADWGHLPANEFFNRAIWRPDHPEHQEFLEIVRNPVLRNPRINVGNLSAYL